MLMLQVVLPYALRLGFEAVMTSDVQGRVACKRTSIMVLWFEFIDFGGFGGHKSWTYICVRGPSQVERWGVLACDEGVQVG